MYKPKETPTVQPSGWVCRIWEAWCWDKESQADWQTGYSGTCDWSSAETFLWSPDFLIWSDLIRNIPLITSSRCWWDGVCGLLTNVYHREARVSLFSYAMEPWYTPCSHNYLSQTLIPNMYKRVRSCLQVVPYVSITINTGTGFVSKPYWSLDWW